MSDVNDHVAGNACNDAHQLDLRKRLPLKMKAAEGSTWPGHRDIVLNEIHIDPGLRQVGLEQAGPPVADKQRFEDAVPADSGQIVGVQQRCPRILQLPVERDHNPRFARHGQEA